MYFNLRSGDLFSGRSIGLLQLRSGHLFDNHVSVKLLELRSRLLFNNCWPDNSMYFNLRSGDLLRGRSICLLQLRSWDLLDRINSVKLLKLRCRLLFIIYWQDISMYFTLRSGDLLIGWSVGLLQLRSGDLLDNFDSVKLLKLRSGLLFNNYWLVNSMFFNLRSGNLLIGRSICLLKLRSGHLFDNHGSVKLLKLRSGLLFNNCWQDSIMYSNLRSGDLLSGRSIRLYCMWHRSIH